MNVKFQFLMIFLLYCSLAVGLLAIAVAPLGGFCSRLTSLLVSLPDSLMDQGSSLYDVIQVIIIMFPPSFNMRQGFEGKFGLDKNSNCLDRRYCCLCAHAELFEVNEHPFGALLRN